MRSFFKQDRHVSKTAPYGSGSLLIQKQYDYSNRELVEHIMENPYYQYFIGLPGFSNEAPYVSSLLVDFRKRPKDELLVQINEMIIAYTTPDDPGPDNDEETPDGTSEGSENNETFILDATVIHRTSVIRRI